MENDETFYLSESMRNFFKEFGELPEGKYTVIPDDPEDKEVAEQMTKMLNYIKEQENDDSEGNEHGK